MIPDNFAAFIVLTTLVSLAPGPNTMFVMSQAALRGHAAGIAAGFGIETANVGYFALTALGLATVLATSAMAFNLLKWVGAGYLVIIGLVTFIRSFRAELHQEYIEAPAIPSSHGAYLDGLMIGLGNPKTIIYFVALLPQFINPARDVLAQTAVVCVVGTSIDLGIQWLYAHAGGALSRLLNRPRVRRWFERGLGSVFMGLALIVALYRRSS
jgi:threonine/homoserine/homoserine lactone efflux protein